jgi:chromosome segregation ATPase
MENFQLPEGTNSAATLFHSITELQRQRVEDELELRRLDTEINQYEFKVNRYFQKLQVLEDTILQTEQAIQQMELKLIGYQEHSTVQEAATAKLQSNLDATTQKVNRLNEDIEQTKQNIQEKLNELPSV